MTVSLEADLGAQLCAAVGDLTSVIRQQENSRQQYARRRNAAISWMIAPAISLAALPALRAQDGGPNTGFYWAVQRITVGPVGAATDVVTVYKGHSAIDVQPQNAIATLAASAATAAGQFLTYHAGGKGVLLAPDESLIAAGVITGTNPVLNWDVIQVEAAFLFDYLV